ncbi:hypothetical protein [Chroococcidiopsis sp. CCMEE 29]|uniref:hypothetical protein n=1 Tax=Chroococcidiopsis sp. CCMEE 29 TaxID=155894 RepID=UPI0020224CAE|nr:hypothetical protein [Chroococcidiopsis sp. CCMEE 29]
MKTAIAGAVLTALSLSLPAIAATTNKFHVKGQNVSANFYQYDDCNSTNVYVSAYNNITKDSPGAPTEQLGAYLDYYNYNYCTGTYSYVSGSSSSANFTIDNRLDSATLNGTFTLYDYSSRTPKTADVALTWKGVGDTSSGKSNYTYQTPTSTIRSRSNGESRDAEVSGSITLDGTNLITNTSNYGYLSSSKSGYLERTAK